MELWRGFNNVKEETASLDRETTDHFRVITSSASLDSWDKTERKKTGMSWIKRVKVITLPLPRYQTSEL